MINKLKSIFKKKVEVKPEPVNRFPDCPDCHLYKMTYPTGKGPCVVCKEAYIPTYMTRSNYQVLCSNCHASPIHDRIVKNKVRKND